MVGLQGLHLSSAFWHSNILGSMGLKLFCPWYLKQGGKTETIATHLREVHYWLSIACDICKAFANMSGQFVPEHHSGCKVKPHKRKSKVKEQEKAS